jgi:hypothetical protein
MPITRTHIILDCKIYLLSLKLTQCLRLIRLYVLRGLLKKRNLETIVLILAGAETHGGDPGAVALGTK